MSKFQMLRLLVALPKVSRLTACQFCASNHMETNVKPQSVFERYVEFQIKNKLPLNYGKVIEEGEEVNNKLELDTATTTVKSQDQGQLNKIHIPDPNFPLRYILNCELMPDVKSAMKREDYLLFHEHLEKTQMLKLPSVSEIIYQTSVKKIPTMWSKRQTETMLNKRQKETMLNKRQKETMLNKRQKENFKPKHTVIHDSAIAVYEHSRRYLSGEKSIEISPDLRGYWNSIKHVLDSFQEADMIKTNVSVYHPLLHYSGVLRFVAVYKNTLCLIDIKISNVQRPHLFFQDHNALSVAARLGAASSSFNPDLIKLGPVTNAVIIFAYPTGQPAHAHYMNKWMVAVYWNQWLEMLYSYWSQISTIQ